MHILHNWMGINLKPYYDTMVGAALLDENQSKRLKDQATKYLKIPSDTFGKLFGKITFNKVPILMNPITRMGSLASFYAIKDTELTYLLFKFQMRYLDMVGMEEIRSILFDIEMPTIDIIYEAEQAGVKFDAKYMKEEVEPVLIKEMETLRQKIWGYVGEINLRSPAQVSEALFVKLKLPSNMGKKPRSTDKKTLKKMKGIHEITDLLLSFRSVSKLVDSFVTKLPQQIINGRLHPNFNNVGTVTLRMSCSKPNLQQIPSRIGNLIRNAFIADEGRLLASCDFSGQEVRVLAHVSRCPVLLDIFEHDKDFHAMTGTGIYNRMYGESITYEYFQYCRGLQDLFLDKDGNIDQTKVDTADELFATGQVPHNDKELLVKETKKGKAFEKIRKNYAKTVNFAIIYGTTEYGLSDSLEVSVDEAKGFIKAFFETYPGVDAWIKEQKKFIFKNKYSLSMKGGKRRLHDLMNSREDWKIQKAYRMGVNSIIQRSSAEMTKIASINLQPLLKELDAKILLFIHDEVIIDVPESIGMDNMYRITEIMCNALPLVCGLKSDIEIGKKWGEKIDKQEINAIRELLEGDDEPDEFKESDEPDEEGAENEDE